MRATQRDREVNPARATLPITLLVQVAASAAILVPAVAAPQLLDALRLGAVAVGLYIAAVYLAAMLSSQWVAVLVRRWGPIRTSQVALACCAVGLLLMAVPHVAAALCGALMLGVGYGPVTPASSATSLAVSPCPRRCRSCCHSISCRSWMAAGTPLVGSTISGA